MRPKSDQAPDSLDDGGDHLILLCSFEIGVERQRQHPLTGICGDLEPAIGDGEVLIRRLFMHAFGIINRCRDALFHQLAADCLTVAACGQRNTVLRP